MNVIAKIGLWIISYFPFWALYILSDFLAFTLLRVVKYRKKVAISNIKRVFPTWTDKEIDVLLKKTYRNLSDIMLEGFKIPRLSKRDFEKRIQFNDKKMYQDLFDRERNSIMLTGHMANWEWLATIAPIHIPQKVILVYKKISNPFFEKYVKSNREKFGANTVEMNDTYRELSKSIDDIYTAPMVSDQSPSRLKGAIMTSFLGIETPFSKGPVFISKRLGTSITYMCPRRIKRGHYQVKSSLLIEDAKDFTDKEIIGKFAKALEKDIYKNPEQWIWTHRRWKLV